LSLPLRERRRRARLREQEREIRAKEPPRKLGRDPAEDAAVFKIFDDLDPELRALGHEYGFSAVIKAKRKVPSANAQVIGEILEEARRLTEQKRLADLEQMRLNLLADPKLKSDRKPGRVRSGPVV